MWGEQAVGQAGRRGGGDEAHGSRPSSTRCRRRGDPKGAAPVAAFHRPQDRRAVRAAAGDAARRGDHRAGARRCLPLVEATGIVPRAEIADDIKALDQDARGLLRKHGVRFGQFTIFLPLLLKPAPTRLRLVLWGLEKGLDRIPDSPPPGLVTIPHEAERARGYYYTMSGYRPPASARSASTCWSVWRTCCAGRTPAAGSRRRPTCCRSPADAGAVRRPDGGLGYQAPSAASGPR
jgi:ATP-dependent RNA helicase SUPV3L1/SUV3